jgi:hypothetical protein
MELWELADVREQVLVEAHTFGGRYLEVPIDSCPL